MKNEHAVKSNSKSRRDFLKVVSAGAAGLALNPFHPAENAAAALFGPDKSEVSFLVNSDIRDATYQALKPYQRKVEKDIGDKQVVIKVNAGLASEEHAKNSTHADQIRGILDFLKPIHDRKIIVTEGTAGSMVSAYIGFENYGYMPLEKEYNIKIVDANDQLFSLKFIRTADHRPIKINIIDMYMDPDVYLISAAKMKTHNAVVGTYSLKNVVMGSPVCHYKDKINEKSKMHGGQNGQGGRELSYNLFLLTQMGVYPDLAVIDGIRAIEGDGPWGGQIVEHDVTIASTDFVAADRICTDLMGIEPKYMKYLEWCEYAGMGNFDRANIKVNGPDVEDHIIKYKLNRNFENQVAWIHENFDE
ncbi:DUF362 domain-containing protein [Candidatus Latescibacterota bacterium]